MMMSTHAPRLNLNPSSADRWTTCTASPQYILDNWDILPPKDTKFSQEGTTAHEVAAATLLECEIRVDDPKACPVPVDGDMRWHGWNYAEYVQSFLTKFRKYRQNLLVEQKLLLWYMPSRNAIVDAAVLNSDSLHIVDYKYGEGVTVSHVNNLQMVIYAKCVHESRKLMLPPEFPVFLHIYQPRGRDAAEVGPVKVWETTWENVERLARKIDNMAKLVQLGESTEGYLLEFAPSEKACQWCPAKGFCEARRNTLTGGIEALTKVLTPDFTIELRQAWDESVANWHKKHESIPTAFLPLAVAFDTQMQKPTLPPAKGISSQQLKAVLTHGDDIIKWVKDAQAFARDHMAAGHNIDGFKLVMSRGGNRRWSDPKKAAKIILSTTVLRKEEVIEESVIGPAAVEKLLGKHKFGADLMNLITRNPGVPEIAPDDDKRPSCLVQAVDEFEALPEETEL